MFLYKNGRMHIKGVSFSIPEGFYIDTANDAVYDNSFDVWSPDKSYRIQYQLFTECDGTKEELMKNRENIVGKYYVNETIKEIEHNGLKGHHDTYGSYYQYYEARFLLEETEKGSTEFVFLAYTKKIKNSIEKIKESAEFKKIFDDIRKENE